MNIKIFYMLLSLACLSGQALAQLSPGDLAKPHAHLEGVANCTKCHVLGDKVSNDKCLSCHKEIKSTLDKGSGYHASREVKGKECAGCHNDHHGRNFNLIRFDKDKFNHSLTGYELTGAHKTTDCRKCHTAGLVEDRELKKRPNTYLGLGRDCKSCHADVHQNTLSNDCAKCHTTDKFSPAAKFDHNKTDFALSGMHKTVACAECHKKEIKNGKEFQRFAGVAFNNCNSCHKDPHNYNLGTNCKECHTDQSFTALTGLKKYNHNQTHFPLKGKHQQVDCAGCHNLVATPLTVFQDKLGTSTNNCAACHRDVHLNKFGSNCADCHTEKTFQVAGIPKDFNHNRTGFELAGKHASVDCKKCHTTGHFTEPLRHFYCADCHTQDYHEGQFASIIGISPDCGTCHAVDGFENSSYSIAQHQKSKFPLDGAHVATPCFACHKPDTGKWKFRNIGAKCADCHTDVHEGFIDKKYYPDKTCERCHVTDSWVDSHFDHNQTKYKLLGAHARQTCMACHGKDDGGKLPQRYQKFANLSTACTACHKNIHDRQFEKEGVTDCLRCHGYENWKAPKFDHNKTAFKLDGKHAKVACSGCHKETEVNGERMVLYKIKRFQCIDCHQ